MSTEIPYHGEIITTCSNETFRVGVEKDSTGHYYIFDCFDTIEVAKDFIDNGKHLN